MTRAQALAVIVAREGGDPEDFDHLPDAPIVAAAQAPSGQPCSDCGALVVYRFDQWIHAAPSTCFLNAGRYGPSLSMSEILGALRALAAGGVALSAAVENELENLGLVVQDDQPYAHLTPEGQALLGPPPIEDLLALAARRALVEVGRTDGTTAHGDLLDVRQGCLVLEGPDGAVEHVHLASVATFAEVDA